MSEKMYPLPFKSLMNWVVTEYAREGEIFGVHTPYYAGGKTLPIFGETIETPFGPAAGPNSQQRQNEQQLFDTKKTGQCLQHKTAS